MKNLYQYTTPHGQFSVLDSRPVNAIEVHQVHSADIVSYQGEDLSAIQADGIHFKYKAVQGKAIIIKTADCLPILILGAKEAVFLHAGWKGLHQKILHHPLIRTIQPEFAFIGPSIQCESFEVTEEFTAHFPENNFIKSGEKLHFDLQQETKDQLSALYPNIQVVDSGLCTVLNETFQSFRRQKTKVRNYNVFEA